MATSIVFQNSDKLTPYSNESWFSSVLWVISTLIVFLGFRTRFPYFLSLILQLDITRLHFLLQISKEISRLTRAIKTHEETHPVILPVPEVSSPKTMTVSTFPPCAVMFDNSPKVLCLYDVDTCHLCITIKVTNMTKSLLCPFLYLYNNIAFFSILDHLIGVWKIHSYLRCFVGR